MAIKVVSPSKRADPPTNTNNIKQFRTSPNNGKKVLSPTKKRQQQQQQQESTCMTTLMSLIRWTAILTLPFLLGSQVCYMRDVGFAIHISPLDELSFLPTTKTKRIMQTENINEGMPKAAATTTSNNGIEDENDNNGGLVAVTETSNNNNNNNPAASSVAAATKKERKKKKPKIPRIKKEATKTATAAEIYNITTAFEKAIVEEFSNSTAIVYICSKDKGDKHFAEMLFPNIRYKFIYYDTAKEDEIPAWSVDSPTFFMWKDGWNNDCANHPFYKEVLKLKKESPKLDPPVEKEWIDGIHWPPKETSGMRLLKDRPMIIGCLGEVFYRERYKSLDDIDLTIFRAKVKPRPGSLTYHDIQGVSHSFRFSPQYPSNTSFYSSEKGIEVWMNPYDTIKGDYLSRYDEQTNNKGFCTLLTGSIFKSLYDMDALVRNSMFQILNEYKPCKRPNDDCPGDDLLSYKCQAGYKFTISMENTQLEGYVSEKIFIGKLAGGVPIYFGAPDAAKYVDTDSFVFCNIQPSVIEDLKSYYKFDRPGGARYNRVFSMFNNTSVQDMDKEKLLDWAVEFLRPHLQPCVDRVIELDKNDEEYNSIRNKPLIKNPEMLTGYASKGLGMAYKYLRTGEFPSSIISAN